jgi:hypothetical protein
MTEILEKIRSRGYWRVVMRPASFIERRIEQMGELQVLLERSAVRLRGWDYPHIDTRQPVKRLENYIAQETDWSHYLETWRFYQSGQFVHYFGLREDWFDESITSSRTSLWGDGQILLFVSTIYEITEILEFAARLALTGAGDDPMRIEIEIVGLKGRRLRPDDINIMLSNDYRADVDKFDYQLEVARGELVSQPRELALRAAQQLFGYFGLDLNLDVLRTHQDGLRRP